MTDKIGESMGLSGNLLVTGTSKVVRIALRDLREAEVVCRVAFERGKRAGMEAQRERDAQVCEQVGKGEHATGMLALNARRHKAARDAAMREDGCRVCAAAIRGQA